MELSFMSIPSELSLLFMAVLIRKVMSCRFPSVASALCAMPTRSIWLRLVGGGLQVGADVVGFGHELWHILSQQSIDLGGGDFQVVRYGCHVVDRGCQGLGRWPGCSGLSGWNPPWAAGLPLVESCCLLRSSGQPWGRLDGVAWMQDVSGVGA